MRYEDSYIILKIDCYTSSILYGGNAFQLKKNDTQKLCHHLWRAGYSDTMISHIKGIAVSAWTNKVHFRKTRLEQRDKIELNFPNKWGQHSRARVMMFDVLGVTNYVVIVDFYNHDTNKTVQMASKRLKDKNDAYSTLVEFINKAYTQDSFRDNGLFYFAKFLNL